MKPNTLKDNAFPDLLQIPDDGFAITTVEPWVKHKIHLIRQYVNAFVTAVAGQVDEVIFVDLYARNGLCCLGVKKDIFSGVPLMALQQNLPISKYVFCESDEEQYRVLKIRTNRYFKEKNIVLLKGKPEELIDKIKMYVSEPRKDHKVATICVADAFGLEPGFEVIKQLNDYDFTFLIPLTFHLGRNISYRFYLKRESEKLTHLLGEELGLQWSEKSVSSNSVFYKQLIQNWERKAEELGMNTATSVHKLDSGLMEMPTYSICLFAKKYASRAIQVDALAGSHIQFALFNQN